MWGNVDSGIREILLVESGIQLKESGILLTIGIGNPRSTDKKPESSRTWTAESTAWSPDSKTIFDSLTFYMGWNSGAMTRNVYMSRDGRGGGGEGVVWRCVRDLVALVLYCTVGLWWEILPLRRLAILSFWKKLGHNSSRFLRKKKWYVPEFSVYLKSWRVKNKNS